MNFGRNGFWNEMVIITEEELKIINSLSYKYLNSRHYHNTDRNQLFELMRPCLLYWITDMNYKFNLKYSKSDIVSISWDCFLFCLKQYKIIYVIPFVKHCYAYTKFYIQLLIRSKKKDNDENLADEFNEESYFLKQKEMVFLNDIMEELNNFKKSLPKDYQLIFENTLNNIMIGTNNVRTKNCKLSQPRFKEATKMFRFIISFLVKA